MDNEKHDQYRANSWGGEIESDKVGVESGRGQMGGACMRDPGEEEE